MGASKDKTHYTEVQQGPTGGARGMCHTCGWRGPWRRNLGATVAADVKAEADCGEHKEHA